MKRTIFLAAIALTIVGVARAAQADHKYEEPQYSVLESYRDNIEIRNYAPRIAAQVSLVGDLDQSRNAGFKILAGYIFGKNEARTKIAMTTPVVTQNKSEKIAMTAPVTAEQSGGQWVIRFYMPSKYKLDTLPKPLDERIQITEIPSQRYAVMCFSGSWSENNFEKHTQELRAFLAGKGIKSSGEALKAHYNPPWTPTFFRRNEILIPLS